MTPTETLKHEHKIILMVLDAAEREAQFIQGTGKIHAEKVDKMLDLIGYVLYAGLINRHLKRRVKNIILKEVNPWRMKTFQN